MSFTTEQIAQLSAPLQRAHVKTRRQAGRELSYIEAWKAIEEANRIFGFGDWSSETIECRCVAEKERQIGKDQYIKQGYGVSYIARVRVTVSALGERIVREGVGAGHGIDADLGQAHESAIKEAESDARKRALMTFGNPFGLALYDKSQENVTDDNGTPAPEQRTARQEAAPAARETPPPVDPKAEALARREAARTREADIAESKRKEAVSIYQTLLARIDKFALDLEAGRPLGELRTDWKAWLQTVKTSAGRLVDDQRAHLRTECEAFDDMLRKAEAHTSGANAETGEREAA